MSLLEDTLKAIRDDKLELPELEKLRDTLIHLKTDIGIQLADKKKARAMFLVQSFNGSVAAHKIAFDATEDGQRLITLEGYLRGLGGEIDALATRIYAKLGIHR